MKSENRIREGLDVAVIGMAARFPGASDIRTFWQNLVSGKPCIRHFSKEELIEAGVSEDLLMNPNFVPAYGALDNLNTFDAPFFGFNPYEAEMLDPQIRLFLECAWNAFEDAGYQPNQSMTGVYAGAASLAYWGGLAQVHQRAEKIPPFLAQLLLNKDSLASLTSFKLNLTGPSCTVQSACSTSLIAVHMACQGLLNGECDLALAGGATVSLPQNTGYLYQEGSIYSSDGQNRTLDADADGTVFGNGAGAVILKRADEAWADGDHIYALIKGSAINNDGNQKAGYLATSQQGQKQVVSSALRMAEFDPETIHFVEMHGTATQLGDPMEVSALTDAFSTSKLQYCALGSVKSNLGHLDSAAGIAGFIKAVLSIYHKCIPPTIGFHRPNSQMDLINSPFYINAFLNDLSSFQDPLRGGVSAFGVGGNNAHVVLEECLPLPTSESSNEWNLFCLSAKSIPSLEQRQISLKKQLRKDLKHSIADMAYTSQVGRVPFRYRKTILVRNTTEAIMKLDQLQTKNTTPVEEPLQPFIIAIEKIPNLNLEQWQETGHSFPELGKRLERGLIWMKSTSQHPEKKRFLDALVVIWSIAKYLEILGCKIDGYAGAHEGEIIGRIMAEDLPLEKGLDWINNRENYSLDDELLETTQRKAYWSASQGGWITENNLLQWSYEEERKLEEKESISFDSNKDYMLFTQSHSKDYNHIVLNHSSNPQYQLLNLIRQLWEKGHSVAWENLHTKERRYRIPLYGYTFDSHPYPLNPVGRETIVDALHGMKETPSSSRRKIKDSFYKSVWQKNSKQTGVMEINPDSVCMAFVPDDASGQVIRREIETHFKQYFLIYPGAAFHVENDRTYYINPDRPQDYQRLFQAMQNFNPQPNLIIHAWTASSTEKDFTTWQNLGFYSLILCTQSWSVANWTQTALDLVVLSSQIFEITGEEYLCPAKATIQAALKVIPQEYTSIRCKQIDLDILHEDKPWNWNLITQAMLDDRQVAVGLRNGRVWREDFIPQQLEIRENYLPEHPVILITGGLGTLGLTLAEELSLKANCHFILTTRRGLHPQQEQNESDESPTATASKKNQVIKLLESRGSQIQIGKADVTDLEAMEKLVDDIITQFGKIDLVIHAAGVIRDYQLISDLNWEHLNRQFGAKVKGIQVLENILSKRNVGQLITTSSMSSILGGIGHAGYAASNIFLDAFITAHNKKYNDTWLSVNIEAFEGPDNQKASDTDNQVMMLGQHEVTLTTQELRTGLECILSGGEYDRLILAKGPLHTRIEQWILRKEFDALTQDGTQQKSLRPRPDLPYDPILPENESEAQMLAIWEDFFGYQELGVTDNFFELGGDSLKSIMLIEKIRKQGGIKIMVSDFFRNPTIRGMASISTQDPSFPIDHITPSLSNEYPLSPGQQGMLLVDQLGGGLANNLIHVSEIKGEIEKERVKDVLEELVKRHDALKTGFKITENGPVQFLVPDVNLNLEWITCDAGKESASITAFQQPFDLSKPPLIRVGLLKSPDKMLFLLDIHHIISDPQSMQILLEEFSALYNRQPLPYTAAPYSKFISWQSAYFESPQCKADEKYWLQTLAGNIPPLNLPVDFNRPAVLDYEGDLVIFYLDEKLTSSLKDMAQKQGMTLFLATYSLYYSFLAKICDQETLLIGTPHSIRQHKEQENSVGLFLNLLPIKINLNHETQFIDLLYQVKEAFFDGLSHGLYPFDFLVEKSLTERDPSRNPLMETGFTMLPQMSEQSIGNDDHIEVQFASYELQSHTSKFDLFLWALEGKELECHFYYRKKLFKRASIISFSDSFRKIAEAVVEDPTIKIGDLKMSDQALVNNRVDWFDDGEDFKF